MYEYISKYILFTCCFLLPVNVVAATYSWTDEQGIIHFTDDEQKRPQTSRVIETSYDATVHHDYSKFFGKWSNKDDSLGFFILIISSDHTGEAQIIQNRIPVTWFVLGDGRIEIDITVFEETKTKRQKQTMKLIAKYDPVQNCLLVKNENDNTVKKLFAE